MLHLDTCFLNLRISLLQTLPKQRCPNGRCIHKNSRPCYLGELVIWILNQKKQLGGKQPDAKKGFHLKGMETGNLKVLHLNTPFCITLFNAVQKELVLVSYNRKACLRPWCNKCSSERCWWTFSNFREMPKSTKTPFIYCNACCIRLLYLDNLPFWLSAMEVASKPATVAFRIAQQTIHICWNI